MLAETFMRIEEFVESPTWKGQVFTRKEFNAWHKECFPGQTYADRWGGFNVPSSAIRTFRRRFRDQNEQERALILALDHAGALRDKRSYIIATVSTRSHTFRHELAHGLFALSVEYRAAARHIVRKHGARRLRRHLVHMGYGAHTIEDEIQAYALSGYPSGIRPTREMEALSREITSLFTLFIPTLPAVR